MHFTFFQGLSLSTLEYAADFTKPIMLEKYLIHDLWRGGKKNVPYPFFPPLWYENKNYHSSSPP